MRTVPFASAECSVPSMADPMGLLMALLPFSLHGQSRCRRSRIASTVLRIHEHVDALGTTHAARLPRRKDSRAPRLPVIGARHWPRASQPAATIAAVTI